MYLRGMTDTLVRTQSPDGFWDGDWPQPASGVKPDHSSGDVLMDRILSTGHSLEWWSLAPEELHPPRNVLASAGRGWCRHDRQSLGRTGAGILHLPDPRRPRPVALAREAALRSADRAVNVGRLSRAVSMVHSATYDGSGEPSTRSGGQRRLSAVSGRFLLARRSRPAAVSTFQRESSRTARKASSAESGKCRAWSGSRFRSLLAPSA